MQGKLFICATPIGNLKDITLRVIETLKEVDLIAAEDTRHTLKLLNHFEIKKPLISYYEHNKQYKGAKIISELKSGKNVALVSDAGTPVISDPGEQLVKECIENGIEIESLPGACAAITAMTLCGLDSRRFMFYGFLSHKKQEKIKELNDLKDIKQTLIFYEAPHKLKSTLECIEEVMGNREISLLRELTKIHQEVLRCDVLGAKKIYEEKEPKGEYVIVLSGAKKGEYDNPFADMSIYEHVEYYINKGFDQKEAIKKCALERDIPKREVYNLIMKKD
ncbi:MAG: 16S rRNA (cytidine(1402)-2'-O)-methyltransferase [Ruminococcaceae bacterium]|nr:16S rRNA (cytidine(1402)-2'-O)-methyltransferase [Oscillospiraceae bacterium]